MARKRDQSSYRRDRGRFYIVVIWWRSFDYLGFDAI